MEQINLTNLTNILALLSTTAVVSMDLGLPYNKLEQSIYTNHFFQILVAFSIIHLNAPNNFVKLIVAFIWLLFKYFKFNYN